MKALLIIAGLFFSAAGAVIAYFAASDPGHEYDLKFVLPIDTRQMPKPVEPPSIQSWSMGEAESGSVSDGRAEAGKALALPERPPLASSPAPPRRPGPGSSRLLKKVFRRSPMRSRIEMNGN